jgi:hypothetical protein
MNVGRVIGYCDRVRNFPRSLLAGAVSHLDWDPTASLQIPIPAAFIIFSPHSTLYNLCSFNSVMKQLYNQSVIASTFPWFHNLAEKHQTK